MSKMFKARRAAQAKKRRRRVKNHLEALQKLASAPGATSSIQTKYRVAQEQHSKLLKSSRERAESWRKKLASDIENKLPSALAKANQLKKAKKAHYEKTKKEHRVSKLKAKWRAARKINDIKQGLIQRRDINGYWVPWRRGQWTPLGVAIKLGDLEGVRWLLKNRASPSKRCTRSLILTPLNMAAEENKPEITELLLEHADLTDDCKSSGALHWAITNQMFRVVKSFIEKGYDLNEY